MVSVLNVTAGQQITSAGGIKHALETDASIDAMRQTAAGEALGASAYSNSLIAY